MEIESENISKEDNELKKILFIKKSRLQEVIEIYRNEIAGLKEQRKQIEKSIEIAELPECEKYSSLMNEKKHINKTETAFHGTQTRLVYKLISL